MSEPTVSTPYERWRRLSPEQRAALREQEKKGALISRLTGLRHLDQPHPGYWLMRVAKGGPLVPACIRWDETTHEPGYPDNDMTGTRSPFLAAYICDEVVDLDRVWSWSKQAIGKADFEFQMADYRWAKQYRPHDPKANPHQKVQLRNLELPF